MTNEEAKKILSSFMEKCKEAKDPYFIVHFSRNTEKYRAFIDSIDVFDALIIIEDLVKYFKINEKILIEYLKK